MRTLVKGYFAVGVGEMLKQGVNTFIMLGAWTVWNHRNRCVFDGISPNLAAALRSAGEQRQFWEMAGARGKSSLTAQLLGD